MRITGGLYRGRTIKCPKGVIRPAMDRMRESMFSILYDLEGKSFLDCFSGSGCIGIEAASRGADPVHLVEKDKIKKQVILENTKMVDSEIELFLMPAEVYIRKCDRTFDFIHLDPPFPLKGKLKFIEMIAEKKLLAPGGKLLMHYPSEESYPDSVGTLKKIDHREYGRSQLIFYQEEQ